MKQHNFSAGPSILPQETIQQSADAVREWDDTGLSLIEVSHRGEKFVQVVAEATSLVKELLDVPSNYEVCFLHGGASLQFCMIPYNFVKEGGKAAYVNTGTWSTKAIKEANIIGKADVIASSEDKDFTYFPQISSLEGYEYLHITTNNTIRGTQLKEDLNVAVPLIADMSSDIFSRKVDVSKYGMIYAGAQKNLGPAGVSIAIVRKDMLGKSGRSLPSMLDYQVHIDKESMFNTPPVFAIYASLQTLKWLKKNGGVEAMAKRNEAKAEMLYTEIDRNSLFENTVADKDRSLMNVIFTMKDDSNEKAFIEFASKRGVSGIKGHRSVGGFRASIYNAMEIESVAVLVKAMQDFEKEVNA